MPNIEYDLTQLNLQPNTYSITVKAEATGYPDSAASIVQSYTVLPQLSQPQNVSVSGTDATFDEVENAESYEFFANGISIGTYTPVSGYAVQIAGYYFDGGYGDVNIYDGQSSSDTLIATLPDNQPFDTTVNVASGYLFINAGTYAGDNDSYSGDVSGGVSKTGGTNWTYSVSGEGSITGISFDACFVEGTKILLADNTTKNVEDITYDDKLLVWNFYEGKLDSAKPCWIMEKRVATEYKKLLLSDGTELRLVGQGDNCHRLFNVTKQQMLYANECVGDEVYKADGSIVTVLSCEKVQETVNYYNLTTNKYLDCFAEGVLTGSRLNNMYHISDMKYDSNERLISEEEEKERWRVRGMEVPCEVIA